MANRWEINIATQVGPPGRFQHLLKVTLPLGIYGSAVADIWDTFRAKFPESEGWKLTLTEWIEREHDRTKATW